MFISGSSSSGGGFKINNSLRLRASNSAYLSRTPASVGNQLKWTFSGWVKLSLLPNTNTLMSTAQSSYSSEHISFSPSGNLQYYDAVGGVYLFLSTAVFRDPSAWYHVVLAYDSANATAGNRVMAYVNGVQVAGTVNVTPSRNSYINYIYLSGVGAAMFTGGPAAGTYIDGYLSHVHFIDGQALDPTSFGQFNSDSVWTPKLYTGSYGTNGFKLDFSNGTSLTTLGYDSSGNNNHWALNNISLTAGSSYDLMTDTPTNNYAVLNPLNMVVGDVLLTNANLRVTSSNAPSSESVFSTVGVSSGRWYCEVLASTITDAGVIGVCPVTIRSNQGFYNQAGGIGYYLFNGTKFVAGANTAYGAAASANDVIGIALDMDSQQVTFYKNNVSQGVISTTLSGDYVFAAGDGSGSSSIDYSFNFGQRPFSYTPPTGFKALCTQNLPAVTVTNGRKHFDVLTWTGNGAGARTITGAQFQPDLVWEKTLSAAYNHMLFDSVRGVGSGKELSSSGTVAEGGMNSAFYGYVSAINADGFSTAPGSTNNIDFNENAQTYAAWLWKAGGAAITNNAGSISSQVSANTTAGFSIVTYSGNGTAGATVGHGLGVAPKMVIAKSRIDSVDGWYVYHAALGGTQAVFLHLTNAAAASINYWNNTSPSSSAFTVGSPVTNRNAQGFVAYCFAEVPGFSKFGSYTGNGSADGPFVFCGFRPRWLLLKNIDSVTPNWRIIDTARDTNNVADAEIYPSLPNAEAVFAALDFTSNGFKIRNSDIAYNSSGHRYIYAAFAENPFGGSNVAPATAR